MWTLKTGSLQLQNCTQPLGLCRMFCGAGADLHARYDVQNCTHRARASEGAVCWPPPKKG